MILRLVLRRLIPLLAALGLALAPVAAPAAVAGMRALPAAAAEAGGALHHAPAPDDRAGVTSPASGTSDLGCGMGDDARPADCPDGCLLMALGLGGAASLLPSMPALPEPAVTNRRGPWSEAAAFASLHGAPQPEPSRA